MILPTPYRFECSRCRRAYAWSLSRIRLGWGMRECARCHTVFGDGSIEWNAATPKQKRQFLLPWKAWVFLLVNVIMAAFAGLLEYSRSVSDAASVAIFVLGLAVIPLTIRLILCAFAIQRSMRRSEQSWLASAGYRPQRTLEH